MFIYALKQINRIYTPKRVIANPFVSLIVTKMASFFELSMYQLLEISRLHLELYEYRLKDLL